MGVMEDIFNRFWDLEDKIEWFYLQLAEYEIREHKEDYDYNFKGLMSLLVLEEQLLEEIVKKRYLDVLKKELKGIAKIRSNPLVLGHLSNSYYFRIIDILERYDEDQGIEYIRALKYDINKIKLRILKDLIDNDSYSDIRRDLINYKYNLLYLNYDNEADFVYGDKEQEVELKSDSFRGSDFPSYQYLDIGFLIYFSKEDIDNIFISSINSPHDKVKVIGFILDFLARLTLCREESLAFILDDINDLFISEMVSEEIKWLFQDLLSIYENIKDTLVWRR